MKPRPAPAPDGASLEPSGSTALGAILSHMRAEPSRTWSLIITLFGDMIVPRGGRLWLGTLLEIFGALEIGGNVVRTAASRLVADGWLERSRVGRNSYYRLAGKGGETVADGARRIYRARPAPWDGAFSMAMTGSAADRLALEQAGYAPLSPGVWVGLRPIAVAPAATILLRATTDAGAARRLAAQVWPTQRLAEGYRQFVAAVQPLAAQSALSDRDALLGRLLLIHEYRRLVLRDPLLPGALLPEDWPGSAARALCAGLYRRLLPGSERWLDEHALNEGGKLPPPDMPLEERFHE